jgi:3-oxoacyl-[acyl-carrier protein] reductase
MTNKKRNILITGGTKGIGKEIAKFFLNNDFFVCVTYAKDESAAKIADKEFAKLSPNFLIKKTNMADENSVQKLQETLEGKSIEPDIVINNAGISHEKPFVLDKSTTINSIMDNNFNSVVISCKIFSKYMIYKKWGKIINISSVAANVGVPGLSAYSASKAAINAYSKSIAKELAKYNISVNLISPGFIETEMTKEIPEDMKQNIVKSIPMSKFGKAEDVAEYVFNFATMHSNYITGSNISIDGGLTS